jgi:hypothetical protein
VEQLFTVKARQRARRRRKKEQLFTARKEEQGEIDKGEGRNGNMEGKAGAR